jgi:integrase
LLTTLQPAGHRGGWKSFLHHIDPGRSRPRRTIALKVPKKLPRVLTTGEVQSILNACDRLRDRFLVALPYDSGMRIGEALGLRHQDIAAAERPRSRRCSGLRCSVQVGDWAGPDL